MEACKRDSVIRQCVSTARALAKCSGASECAHDEEETVRLKCILALRLNVIVAVHRPAVYHSQLAVVLENLQL